MKINDKVTDLVKSEQAALMFGSRLMAATAANQESKFITWLTHPAAAKALSVIDTRANLDFRVKSPNQADALQRVASLSSSTSNSSSLFFSLVLSSLSAHEHVSRISVPETV
eukprot:m.231677 g.231677  ORF g.231677 m.231677 type:complete len:112 (-) comp54278_c5_seq3:395-730(-)